MISILMPIKNESSHIVETIESIKSQTYKNFEVIAIDDNSSDDTIELFKSCSVNDPRFSIYSNPGNGIIPALRFCATKITGNYVTRQDADDLMPTGKLQELRSLLQKYGKNHVATGLVKYFSNEELGNGFINYEEWLNNLCFNNGHYDHIFKECVIASSNWMLHIEDFERIKKFDDTDYPEDYHLVFNFMQANLKVISSKEITHLWRDHSTRASRNLEQYRDQKFFPLKVKFFKKIHGDKDICLWGAGPTGKKLARELLKNDIKFHWVTNNENKIGKNIYDTKIFHYNTLSEKSDHQLLISVTQRNALSEIYDYLESISLKKVYEF